MPPRLRLPLDCLTFFINSQVIQLPWQQFPADTHTHNSGANLESLRVPLASQTCNVFFVSLFYRFREASVAAPCVIWRGFFKLLFPFASSQIVRTTTAAAARAAHHQHNAICRNVSSHLCFLSETERRRVPLSRIVILVISCLEKNNSFVFIYD